MLKLKSRPRLVSLGLNLKRNFYFTIGYANCGGLIVNFCLDAFISKRASEPFTVCGAISYMVLSVL